MTPEYEIEEEISIGPFCILREGVHIKNGTKLVSNVIIEGKTEIGENCTVYPFTSLGFPPQDLKYKGEKTGLKIGNNNIIREYTTIHRASVGGDGITTIGDNNFFMAYVHIAHDCKIGSSVIMSNVATLAGHVIIEDHAYIGGIVAVHQFTRIGAYSMVGGFSGIGQDIPPYTKQYVIFCLLLVRCIARIRRNILSDTAESAYHRICPDSRELMHRDYSANVCMVFDNHVARKGGDV